MINLRMCKCNQSMYNVSIPSKFHDFSANQRSVRTHEVPTIFNEKLSKSSKKIFSELYIIVYLSKQNKIREYISFSLLFRLHLKRMRSKYIIPRMHCVITNALLGTKIISINLRIGICFWKNFIYNTVVCFSVTITIFKT